MVVVGMERSGYVGRKVRYVRRWIEFSDRKDRDGEDGMLGMIFMFLI